MTYLVKKWDVLFGRSLGKRQEEPQHEALSQLLVSRRDLSLFALSEIWWGGSRGKNSPFCNELRQQNSFPLPKCMQEGRGRKGGAAAAQPPLYLHFRAPDKHIQGCWKTSLAWKTKAEIS